MQPICSASLEEVSLLTFLGVVVEQVPYCVCDKPESVLISGQPLYFTTDISRGQDTGFLEEEVSLFK